MKSFTVTVGLMMLCAAAFGAEYFVKTDGNDAATGVDWGQAWRTISNAVAKTPAGNTVVVSNGLYNTVAEIRIDKGLTVRSFSGGPAATIVRRGSVANHRIFYLQHANAVVEGFTITNGNASGGGVYISTNGTVRNCVITGNSGAAGGGLYLHKGGLAENCQIVGNKVGFGARAGGVYSDSGLMRNCLIRHNMGDYTGGVAARGNTVVQNCTIVGNSGGRSGGGYDFFAETTYMSNSICMFNVAAANANYSRAAGAVAGYTCTEPLFVPGLGNVALDPEFADPAKHDYRLLPGSPCRNTARNQPWMAVAVDLAGNPRTNGVVDMGAFEYWPGALECNLIGNRLEGLDSLTVVFRAYVDGTNTSGLGYAWDFNGDGSYELPSSGRSVVTNTYSSNGFYTVKLSVTNAVGETDTRTKARYIRVGPSVAYMSKTGSHTFPYTNWVMAATNMQKAVDIGVNGTLIRVKDDQYALGRQLSISNGVTLRSEGGYTRALLNGGTAAYCVYLNHTNAVVDGFTITNGASSSCVYLYGKGTVQNCLITKREGSGVGVYLDHGGLVRNSVIKGIRSNSQSGAAGVTYYGGTIRNCLVVGNEQMSIRAGGVWMCQGGLIESCTFVRNKATSHANGVGGIQRDGTSIVRNNILYYNIGLLANNYYASGGNWTYNGTVPAFGTSGVTNEPGFVDAGGGYGLSFTNGNFRLLENSPCRDKGINQTWMTGALDLAGNTRIWQNKTVDIGAYEWRPPFGTVLILQ